MSIIAKKIEIDFTDDKITSSGGGVFLSPMSSRLERVPGRRRLGGRLCRFDESALKSFYEAARAPCSQALPAVIEHELSEKGRLPLYDGSRGYWIHGVFAGRLWTSQRLWPGGVMDQPRRRNGGVAS